MESTHRVYIAAYIAQCTGLNGKNHDKAIKHGRQAIEQVIEHDEAMDFLKVAVKLCKLQNFYSFAS